MLFFAKLALKLSPVGAFLKRLNLSQIALVAMAALCLFLKLSLASEQRHSVKLETQLVKSVEGRKADRIAYETAQRDAAARNHAQVATIEAKQQEITDEVRSDYQTDLARLRAQLLRNAAVKGSASGANPGKDGKPAQGVDGDGVPLRSDEYLQAAEIELRLMHLQNWVEEQGKVAR